jgi:hypothetical protein
VDGVKLLDHGELFFLRGIRAGERRDVIVYYFGEARVPLLCVGALQIAFKDKQLPFRERQIIGVEFSAVELAAKADSCKVLPGRIITVEAVLLLIRVQTSFVIMSKNTLVS